MELFGLFSGMTYFAALYGAGMPYAIYYGIGLSLFVLIVLFVLQGIGLYTMGKNRDMKGKWLAFVPFANIWFMGKLAGDCEVFGHKLKRAGLYTMIAQIVTTLFCGLIIAAQTYLYVVEGAPQVSEIDMPYWPGLTSFSLTVFNFYTISEYLLSILSLVYEIFMFILIFGLLKRYSPKNHTGLGVLAVFVPLSRFIIVFAIRKRRAIDYEAYMRARREEFMRRQQYRNSYNGYGNPYNAPYGNRYTYNPQSTAQNPEEPFSEFASDKKDGSSYTPPATDDPNDDGFFN